MNVYEHTAQVTTKVHDELIGWAAQLLTEAGLDVVDVWGRFPPEGTTRSHLVMFPYRVGPDPKMMDNTPAVSLFTTPGRPESRATSIPPEWSDLGMHISQNLEVMYPDVEPYDPKHQSRSTSPYPLVDALPAPLAAWYRERSPDSGWVIEDDDGLRGRPPSLRWRQGITVSAYYICVAGDPGRGTAARTSDTAPLALAALSVLSVGIQNVRTMMVRLPHRPIPAEFFTFADAFADSLALSDKEGADKTAERIRGLTDKTRGDAIGEFSISPVHDLNNQEFALLTQALQRPLQAILNLRIRIPVGAVPEFMPSASVMVHSRGDKGR